MNPYRLGPGIGPSAYSRHILSSKISPVGQNRGKGNTNFVCTQLQKAVSGPAGERILQPLCESCLKRDSVVAFYQSEPAMRGEERG